MLEADMARFFACKTRTISSARRRRSQQPPRPFKIVYVEVDATDTDARGGEPVLAADGRCIGVTTSGRLRPSRQQESRVCLRRAAVRGSGQHIRGAHPRRAARRATVLSAPAFDADNSRMRV
jgi:dimethylglycine dehydrogenase